MRMLWQIQAKRTVDFKFFPNKDLLLRTTVGCLSPYSQVSSNFTLPTLPNKCPASHAHQL